MKIAGLFAGIGGLELGFRQHGHDASIFSEIWQPAATVLSRHFANVPNAGDVATLADLPSDVELMTAGFPCQDLSQAGKTIGITGSRSGLVGHVFRLIDARRVPWVVLENVSFMLSLDGGRAMKRLTDAFEERGYRWAYRVVNSLAFLPQRRERVFFVASLEGDPADILLVDEAPPRIPETDLDLRAHGFYWTEGVRGLGWAADAIPTLKNGSTVGIASPPAIIMPDGRVVKPDIRDAERLQGFPVDWTSPIEASMRRSWRWSLVGNAVTVPVAAWLAGRFGKLDRYEIERDMPLAACARWPRAARFDGRSRKAVRISEYPVWTERAPLREFLQFEPELLSARATSGFLSRTERSSLRFVPGFQDRLREHLVRMRGRQMHAAE